MNADRLTMSPWREKPWVPERVGQYADFKPSAGPNPSVSTGPAHPTEPQPPRFAGTGKVDRIEAM